MPGSTFAYSSNHLEYSGYGNVAPAPFIRVWATAAPGAHRPTLSASTAARMIHLTRRFALIVPPVWATPMSILLAMRNNSVTSALAPAHGSDTRRHAPSRRPA